MSRIIDFAREIDREFEAQRHMLMELQDELDQEKKCRKRMVRALQELLAEFGGEEQ